MDCNERDYDLTDDDDDVTSQRARAKGELNQIAQRARQALDEQGIDTPVFFLAPNSGDAVLLYGTVTDPTNDQWEQVSQTVLMVVRQAVGVDAVRCREVVCAATTDVVTGNEHLPDTSLVGSPDGDLPIPTSTLQHTGAER